MKIVRIAALAVSLPALAAAAPAFAQAQPAAPDILTETIEVATPAMWRVADADSEMILLGTFHILPPSLEWRNDTLAAAFDAADVVWFEVDANAPDAQTKTVNTVMTQGFNPQGVTLTGMLNPEDAQKLQEIVGELKLPFAAIDTMRPWNAFLSLSVQFIINQGFQPGSGVDSVLLADAKAGGKDVRFFETIEQQLAFFTGLSPEVEKELLLITIRDWDDQTAAFDDLFTAWATGDAELIDTNMNDDMRDQAPEVYERLIVSRNAEWAEVLDASLEAESGKVFVAVGAAHLVGGEFSVPALLKAKGYEVSRYGVEPEAANDNKQAQ
ncbi:TraB/GumN family protein [Hyphococcus sp.]|uniref:TraB/GumN family protein n=1 Tax=Hyphococcus sp. TaxID=2038636 RepID=UPI003D11CD44